MNVLGITGGIGSGKSIVSKVFSTLNIPVFNSDEEAKSLYNDKKVLKGLSELFGNSILNEQGNLVKEKLANIVFSDPKKLSELNAFLHPKVGDRFQWFLKIYKNCPYVIKEAAILIESGAYKSCSHLLLVTCMFEERIQRVMSRDSISKELVIKRVNNQWSDDQKIEYCDYFIENSSLSTKSIISQVIKIDKELRA